MAETHYSRNAGTLSAEKQADDEIQYIVDEVKDEVETHLGFTVTELKAIRFSAQEATVDLGTNYFIKTHTGNNHYVHIRVHQPINTNNYTLVGVERSKTLAEPIGYF